MKIYFLVLGILISFLSYSQNNTVNQIDAYIKSIDSLQDLTFTEYDLKEILKIENDQGAVLQIWKSGNNVVKVKEQFYASMGRYARTIYLKNKLPLKALEMEQSFDLDDGEINYSKLNTTYQLHVYVLKHASLNQEYEFKVIKQGKTQFKETYCDYESVFSILTYLDQL